MECPNSHTLAELGATPTADRRVAHRRRVDWPTALGAATT